ncbi:innexin unc-9-like [Mytilus californianus]|uniref:innexin unc-9-like n=1 Tax=Mytilus californianus TaxID=6549 RepID=UPI00224567B3|nr:innexin unc-9-like [Mytilus californianus]
MIFNFYKPTVNYGSWADRFSSTWTFLLLLILALLTAWRHYGGPNFICQVPTHFTQHMTAFAEESCWLSRQIILSESLGYFSDSVDKIVMPDKESLSEDSTRTLYQWLPLILALQALLFLLPDIILRICESSFGFGCQKLSKMIQDYRQNSADDRKSFAIEIGSYLHQEFSERFLTVLPFGILTVLLAFVKLLFFVNAATQLIILEGYLSPQNVTSYGQYVFESITNTNYSKIAYSPVFPREVLCDLKFITLSNVRKYAFQCLVPVNEFNEQICFFVWIWILVVCVAAGTSGILFLVKSLLPMARQRYIKKYLCMSNISVTSSEVSSFSGTTIGQDGVMVLKMIGDISSDILVKDIVIQIWNIHRSKEQQNTISAQQTSSFQANIPGSDSHGQHVTNVTPAAPPKMIAMDKTGV